MNILNCNFIALPDWVNNEFIYWVLPVGVLWVVLMHIKKYLVSSQVTWQHIVGRCLKHKWFAVMLLMAMWFAAVNIQICKLSQSSDLKKEQCTVASVVTTKEKTVQSESSEPSNEEQTESSSSLEDWKKARTLSIFICSVILIIGIGQTVKEAMMQDERPKKDAFNIFIQSVFLGAIGVLVIGIVVIFNISSSNFLPFGMCSVIVGLIFKDTIKGVLVYYHMYYNGLIHIGDWIKIGAKGIDGKIIDISLLHVTIQNWDETIASIPILSLQSEHVDNLANMLDGKTKGRRMLKSFIIDTTTVKSLTQKDVVDLSNNIENKVGSTIWMEKYKDSKRSDFVSPVLNVTLFRYYLLHWLNKNNKISQEPRLLVRLQDPIPEGLPLEVYAFITEYGLQPYELVQSEVMEHVVLAMEWFGLRLYQRPSDYMIIDNCEKGGLA